MSSSVFYFIEHGGSYFVLFKCKKRKNRHIHLILLYTFDVKVKNKLDVKRDIIDDQKNIMYKKDNEIENGFQSKEKEIDDLDIFCKGEG